MPFLVYEQDKIKLVNYFPQHCNKKRCGKAATRLTFSSSGTAATVVNGFFLHSAKSRRKRPRAYSFRGSALMSSCNAAMALVGRYQYRIQNDARRKSQNFDGFGRHALELTTSNSTRLNTVINVSNQGSIQQHVLFG